MNKKSILLISGLLILSLLFVGCGGGGSGGAGGITVDEEIKIKETLDLFVEGFKNKDVDKIIAQIDNPIFWDYEFLSHSDWKEYFEYDFEDEEILQFELKNVKVSRNNSIATVSAQLDIRIRDIETNEIYSDSGLVQMTLKKYSSKWLISGFSTLDDDPIEEDVEDEIEEESNNSNKLGIEETLNLFVQGYKEHNADMIIAQLEDPLYSDDGMIFKDDMRAILMDGFKAEEILDCEFTDVEISIGNDVATVTTIFHIKVRDKETNEIYSDSELMQMTLVKHGSKWFISKI